MQKYLIDKFVSGASVILFFFYNHQFTHPDERMRTGRHLQCGCYRSHAGLEAWQPFCDFGHIFQGNEGKYNFDLDDWTHPDKIVFELAVPKCAQKKKPAMLDTSNVESW